MQVTDPRSAHDDSAEYKGLENIPALFLRNALVNEYFGDLVKQEIIRIQFTGKGNNAELVPVAGYLTSGLRTGAGRENKEAWFSGCVGDLDAEALSALKKDGEISFPGWIQGWSSADDAGNYLKTLAAADHMKGHRQVIIHVTDAPVQTALGNRLVAHRLHGKVSDDVAAKDGEPITVNIAAEAYDEASIADSIKAVAEKAAAAPPTTEAENKENTENPENTEPKQADDGAGGDQQ